MADHVNYIDIQEELLNTVHAMKANTASSLINDEIDGATLDYQHHHGSLTLSI